MLFGSVTDVLDRYLPDAEPARSPPRDALVPRRQHHLPRARQPGSAAAPAFGLAMPDENAKLMQKLRGGIGALTAHLVTVLKRHGGKLRWRIATCRCTLHSTACPPSPPRTRRSAIPRCSRPSDSSAQRRNYSSSGRTVGVGSFPRIPRSPCSSPRSTTEIWHPRASTRCRRSRCGSPSSTSTRPTAISSSRWVAGSSRRSPASHPISSRRIIRHTTFTPRHMGTMFGAPGGDYCHGLIHPEQMGPNHPGPRGFTDQPIPIDGLYLGSAGCHGGPGITFIPGCNAAVQALNDAG